MNCNHWMIKFSWILLALLANPCLAEIYQQNNFKKSSARSTHENTTLGYRLEALSATSQITQLNETLELAVQLFENDIPIQA